MESPESAVPRAAPLADYGQFFVGGEYVPAKDGTIRIGQMYVQYFVPDPQTKPHPVVLWHGGGQTGASFMGTADGQRGWCDHFLRQGYVVYVVDQPARGRSGSFTDRFGEMRQHTAESMTRRFTAPAHAGLFPQARLHTQFPGPGTAGDAHFDDFIASQVEDIADFSIVEQLNLKAGMALLEKVGRSILLTHSQSCPVAWELGDARPELVAAILAVEPNGPPFHEVDAVGPPVWFRDGRLARPWGITRLPLTFDPPLSAGEPLAMQLEPQAESPDHVRCWLQPEPARQLRRLSQVPILIVSGEASYHTAYDHCTSRFLTQAGVKHEFVRLADVGIRGNGHLMMLEKNSLEIAVFLESRLRHLLGLP